MVVEERVVGIVGIEVVGVEVVVEVVAGVGAARAACLSQNVFVVVNVAAPCDAHAVDGEASVRMSCQL